MPTILVTGGSRGIGAAVVQQALARGDFTFAAMRSLADSVELRPHAAAHPLQMDVADDKSVLQAFEQLDRVLDGRSLDAVVHCAAISFPGAIELTSMEEFERTHNTNFLGTVRVLKSAIPRMRQRGGRVVLVTSLWGQASGALLGAYCSSKHAIESLADCARRELAGSGVQVIVVEPGVVLTDMYYSQGRLLQQRIAAMSPEQERRYRPIYTRYLRLAGGAEGQGARGVGISAEQCARDIERALLTRKPQPRYQSGADSKALCGLSRQRSDRWMDAFMLKRLNNEPLEDEA